jgi:CelD/BcsL family acetyltransferase involved in cellulose biosynthesis
VSKILAKLDRRFSLRKVRRQHEAAGVFSVCLCVDELGSCGGPLLFHYWEERHLVEAQICTQTQELDPASFHVKVISNADEFNSIGSQWDRLVQRAGVGHPFLSHVWFRTWWEAFGRGSSLYVVSVWADAELLAVAPMQRTRMKFYGIPVEAITSIYNPHTPRFDFILATDAPREILYKLIWNKLSGAGCDVVVLQQIPTESNTLMSIEQLAQYDEWAVGWWAARRSPYIPLAWGVEELDRINGSHRYLRKRHDRLSRLGPVDVEVITDSSEVHDAMRDGLRIEAAAWKGDQGTAILSDPDVTTFYTRLAEREAELGNLRLSFLRVGGKRISFGYILRSQYTLYGVKIGYDPEYHAYSPGHMHLNLILREAFANGYREYDFLGADDAWKFDWTNESRAHHWLFLFANRWPFRLLHGLKFGVFPKIKQCMLRPRL